jgi:hypothetical protein
MVGWMEGATWRPATRHPTPRSPRTPGDGNRFDGECTLDWMKGVARYGLKAARCGMVTVIAQAALDRSLGNLRQSNEQRSPQAAAQYVPAGTNSRAQLNPIHTLEYIAALNIAGEKVRLLQNVLTVFSTKLSELWWIGALVGGNYKFLGLHHFFLSSYICKVEDFFHVNLEYFMHIPMVVSLACIIQGKLMQARTD